MSYKAEDLGKNMVKLTIEVPAEEFDKDIEKAYQKDKNKITVQGFRKGKAPRVLIEKVYGAGVFYETAANFAIQDAYEAAYEQAENDGLKIVSRPEIDVSQVEKGKPFIFTATVAKEPEVTLGEYKGIEVSKTEIKVTEEEIKAEIDKEREKNAREIDIDNRSAIDGDIVNIDFDGYVDGKSFEGGKSEKYSLTLGSHSFIDGFEEQIIGKNIGDEFEVNVTFPEKYQAENLAGKPAVFKCKLNGIKKKEMPEADDEFAKDVTDFSTLEEYKADIEKTLKTKKENAAKTAKEDEVVKKIVENSTMDVPEAMIETEQSQIIEQFANRLRYQGLDLKQYLQFTNSTPEQFKDSVKPEAEKRIKSTLVLRAVANAEKLEASEDEINA